MESEHLFGVYPGTGFGSRDTGCAISAQHRPEQNRLLAALPLAEYDRLLPHLHAVSLLQGQTVQVAGEREKYVYFLTTGIVCKFYLTRSGASTGISITGSEGVIGLASFLGGESTLTLAVASSAAYAYRLAADRVKNEFKHGGTLPQLLLRFTQALISQTGQIAVCNRHHSVEQQLCRWILSCLDRLPSNELAMTQESIANMLGVRREGVTEVAIKLQDAGLIRYGRGRIAVLDRPALEARACECYAVVKREYDHLLHSINIRAPKSLLRAAPATLASLGASA